MEVLLSTGPTPSRFFSPSLTQLMTHLFVAQPRLQQSCQIHRSTHVGEKPYQCNARSGEQGLHVALIWKTICKLIQERRYKTATTMEKDFHGVIFSNKHTDTNHIDTRGGTGFSKKHWRPLSVCILPYIKVWTRTRKCVPPFFWCDKSVFLISFESNK